MQLRILGPVQAVTKDRRLTLGGAQQRAVLTQLALETGRAVSRAALVDGIWADDPPDSAVNTVQVHVSQLRKSLGREVIRTVANGYALGSEIAVDRDRFIDLLSVGSRELEGGDATQAAATLRTALQLWAGAALADVAHYPFARSEVARLEELRLVALERRIDADLECGRHRELAGELEALVERYPLREGMWAQLMLAQYRCGRQADALAAFHRARDRLVGDLGIEPGSRLRELENAILAQDNALIPRTRSVPGILDTSPKADEATVGHRNKHRNADTDPPAGVHISLLGGFSVAMAGTPVGNRWRLRKAQTLVKLLALAPGHRLHREVVVEALWPGTDAKAAANNLHQLVHAVRSAMGAASIELHGDVVRLGPHGGFTVDVEEFELAAADARTTLDVPALQRALAMWTGPLLPEDRYAEWAAAPRERLAETHAALVTVLGSTLFERGQPDAALAQLAPLAAARPVDEPLHRLLIEVLVDRGRRWEGIEAYERLREALDRAFAADPEPQTRALYRRLFTGGNPTPTVAPHNLPESSTSFVGRRRCLRDLAQSLERTRLLSLIGVGGVGKSRLALEVARSAAGRGDLPDGVWLVELAGIDDPEVVVSTCASALALTLPSGPSPAEALAQQLACRALLLVIDNCEHLLDAVCGMVSQLLARCPDVCVVTTSREPLALPGELVYRVPSLELPPTDTDIDITELSRLEAVQLFVERAWLAVPSFRLSARNAAPVARICRRLDGIPLAVELAAARLAHLTVDELAEGLGDALTLLGQRGHGRLDRQQTLAATLDWSHGLLTEGEQVAFRRLAVFAGGFDLAAAATVCGLPGRSVGAVVSRLVDKSLIHADTTSGSNTRYRLLEVVRQYAAARLIDAAETADCRRRHLQWFVEKAAEHDPDRGDAVVGEPSGWFDVEQDNLRAAMSAAFVTNPTLSLRLATATWRFWVNRGLIAEGAWWLNRALGACDDRSALRARALAARSVVLIRQGRVTELATIGEEIAELLNEHGDPEERTHGRHQQALLTFMAGDWGLAEAQIAETLRLSARFPAVAASAHHFAGVLALNRGEAEAARARFDAALRALERVSDDAPPFFITMALGWAVDERQDPPLPFGEETLLLGRRVGAQQAAGHVRIAAALTERLSGNCEAALSIIEDARVGFDALGDRYGQAYALAQRGHTLRWVAECTEADRSLKLAESMRRELHDQRAVAMTLTGRALTAAGAGRADDARALGREAVAMMEQSGDTAGFTVAGVNLAVAELLSSDLPAALTWLDHSLARFPIPGGHRSLGWLQLLRVHVLRQLGDAERADIAAAAAQTIFDQLGERCGVAAVKRMCKESRPTIRTRHQAPGRRHDTRTG